MGKKFCFAILFLFAISFTVADQLFGILQPDGVYVTVPDLCGQQESQLELPQWAELEATYRYSDQTPAGVVMSQTPPSGTKLKIREGGARTLSLTVSLGAEKKTVPNVLGQDHRIASATLRDHGFTVNVVYTSEGDADRVIKQSPEAGADLPVGSAITLTVGRSEPAQTVTVPDLTGLSEGHALMELFRRDLSVGNVTSEASDASEGTVIRQSPTAGSIVAPSTKINLTISQGST